MAKLRPLANRVIIKRQKSDNVSAGGIIIPDNAQEKAQRGEVLAVGPGKLLDNGERVAPGVAPGNVIAFGKYSGSEIDIDGDTLLVMNEDDILAVYE